MARRTLRRLTLSAGTFGWRREHVHGADGCSELLVVYRLGAKKSPLRVRFEERPGWQVGYPEAGIVWATDTKAVHNLNQPSLVAAIVRHALAHGWTPEQSTHPHEIADGISLLVGLA